MVADNLPPPQEVVNLLQMYNIGKVRIFQAHQIALRALANTGIEVIVGVGNDELQIIAGDEAAANGWVKDNISSFYPSTNIKYIAVGNEVLSNSQYIPYLVEAMKTIQAAIQAANLQNNIKVSTTHASSVLGNSYPPSQGEFRADVKDIMKSILDFLAENESPFMANVYPYFSYLDNKAQISSDYALFRSSTAVVNDGGLLYKNLFDAMIDSLIAAVERMGYLNIEIMVTESGWPSESGGIEEAANMENARIYNNNLIRHVLSEEGTPRRPERLIDAYIFGLFNENLKFGQETERHFGLFYPDEIPVYHVDFSFG
ncbi:glucan endo-1,3-beta-glucosidase-like [Cryptomeria japonica]|uniref:glucan endo-1,3-beta-glucosidase-like n=1 Tax=Cryptomeria japonica TaxID=3369 RepID=UPI0025AD816C|nr:glucan endo-1,3-beta-glucosidase-like [Cryptomeria japonica]